MDDHTEPGGPARPEEPARRRAGTRLACVAAVAIATAGLWFVADIRHSLRVPLKYDGDAMLYLPLIKSVHENNTHWENPRMGAVEGFVLYDFPMPEHGHFLTLKALCLVSRDPVLAYNLFILLQFPAAALTGTWVLRRFGIGVMPSVLAGVLFAYLPHHGIVSHAHIFLCSYYPIPLAILLVVRVFEGNLIVFARSTANGRICRPFLTGAGWGAVGICALVSSTGAYYAFFLCALLVVAGLANALERRRFAGPMRATFFIGLVSAGLGVNLAPSLLHQREHGANPNIERAVSQGNFYALRPCELILPSLYHRSEWAAGISRRYLAAFGTTVLADTSVLVPLGVAGSAGLLLGLGALLRRGAAGDNPCQQILSRLLVAALLIAVAGGFGPLFNFAVSPWIRCYYRLVVFIGFLALASLALTLDRLAARWEGRWPSVAVRLGMLGFLAAGMYDQTSPAMIAPYGARADLYRSDRDFVNGVERALPEGAAVFQLPHIPYPESPSVGEVSVYDPSRPYLHSEKLRWSYGAALGRPSEAWSRALSEIEPRSLASALVVRGFVAVWVDRGGYPGRVAPMEKELAAVADGPPIASPDGRHAVYAFTQLRDRVAAKIRAGEPLDLPVALHWGQGFSPEETSEATAARRWRWCETSEGEATAINFAPEARRCRLRFDARAHSPLPCRLRIVGLGIDETLTIIGGVPFDAELRVPPGMHSLKFTCDGDPGHYPSRELVFALFNYRFEPISDRAEDRGNK